MFEHSSGILDAFDRTHAQPAAARVVFREDRLAQAAEINEAQSIIERRGRRVGDMTAKDGDRVDGGDIVVTLNETGGAVDRPLKGTITLASGKVYIAGDIRPIAATIFQDVPLVGEVTVGARLRATNVTELEDPTLVGLQPGSEAEGEPGAARVNETIAWALPNDNQQGTFFGVYLIKDGSVIDQTPPPALSGVTTQIARYDFDANGHYIVDGCDVGALGKIDGLQVFSIDAGTANIKGFKRIRETATRHAQPEEPDLEAVAVETHTFTGPTGGSAVIPVDRAPIAAVTSAVVQKRITETIVRGGVSGGSDALGSSSIVQIETVVQGGTTFATSAYTLSGTSISWAPAGSEPASGSTYQVTYIANVAVTPTAITATSVTVAGGVNGKSVFLSYTSKLPRIDLLCMDVTGRPAYVKGISARRGAVAPITPSTLLHLATITNDWMAVPSVSNDGTRNYTYDEQRRFFQRLVTVLNQFDRSEQERDILARAPVAKSGIFTDTFVDDFYRDQGEAQTAAANRGVLQLGIDDVLVQLVGTTPVTLAYDEEIVVRQDKRTSSMEINPYDNFTVMPGGMVLEPAVDFWKEEVTSWTSPITREFTTAPDVPPGQTEINEVTDITQTAAAFLRQIGVHVKLDGFGVGENLATLTFDGIDVKPAGTQTADATGKIVLDFTIPPNMPVGRRRVRAEGAAGSFAEAIYVGQGTIDVTTMRRVTLIARAAPVPVVVTNITVINQITQPVINTIIQTAAPEQQEVRSTGEGRDPLAQTFILPEPRHVVGINFRFTAIGNRAAGVRVQLVTVQNGLPTREVLAEAFVSMATVQVGDLVQARFALPVFCTADREFAFVVLTADPTHALAISRLGDVDTATQQRVSSQPYTVGVLLSSSNRLTWTPHNDADLHFQIVAAKFSQTARTVTLWTGPFAQISDVIVRGTIDLPTDAAVFRYELVRADGRVIALAPGQTFESPEYITETVTLRAVLTGTEKIAPVLYPGTLLIGGRIKTSGTYITRAFPMGSAVEVHALFAAYLPAGAAVAVDVDATDDAWTPLPADGADVLGSGWTEPRWKKTPFTAPLGRVRLTLTGGPGARAAAARLRAYAV